MLRFQALGDGNCLYNTEAAWLIKTYREGNLEQLLNNKDFVQNLGRLLTHTSECPDTIDLKAALGKSYTKTSIKRALDKFTQDLTDEEDIDWVQAQKMLAQGLRALVADRIQNDPAILQQIKIELNDAINYCITLSTQNDVQVSFHFDRMPDIQAKVKELVQNKRLNQKQRQDALRNWFFDVEGETVGLNHYLYSENGIATPGIEAGQLEMKVLSHLLHHVIRFYDKKRNEVGHQINVIDGFKADEEAEKHPKTSLVFHMEKVGNHWNALLPSNAASKKLLQQYKPQRDRYIVKKQAEENLAKLQEILDEHGSFAAHHQNDLDYLEENEYLKIHGLTKEQYDENTLPLNAPSKKPTTPSVKKRTVGSGPSVPPKKAKPALKIDIPGPNALLAKILKEHKTYAAHHKKDLADLTAEEYINIHGLTQEQYEKNILPAVPRKAAVLVKTKTPTTPSVKSKVGADPSVSPKKATMPESNDDAVTDEEEVIPSVTETPVVSDTPTVVTTPSSKIASGPSVKATESKAQAGNSFLLNMIAGVAGLAAVLLLASSFIPQFFALMNPAIAGLLLVTCVVATTIVFLGRVSDKTSSQRALIEEPRIVAFSEESSIDLSNRKSFAPQLRAYQQKNTQSVMENVSASRVDTVSLDNNTKKYQP